MLIYIQRDITPDIKMDNIFQKRCLNSLVKISILYLRRKILRSNCVIRISDYIFDKDIDICSLEKFELCKTVRCLAWHNLHTCDNGMWTSRWNWKKKIKIKQKSEQSGSRVPRFFLKHRISFCEEARIRGDFWNKMVRWRKWRKQRTRDSRLASEGKRRRERQATLSWGWPRFSYSFYRAKRRRRRQQRERRLSIFTSNEFELKTFLPSSSAPHPLARSLAAPRPRPPPSCLDHAATLCSTNHANHCAA